MDKGSHMINGRTYRNILTTNEQKPSGPVEPQKLNIITSNAPDKEAEAKGRPKGVIPFVIPKLEGWHPEGTDLSKMITTHDERDVEDMSDEPEPLPAPPEALHECAGTWVKKVDADFKADADQTKAKKPTLTMIEHPVFQGPLPEFSTETNGGNKYADMPEKKKAGRPKKEK